MTVVPLNDKILVERLEAEEKTAGGIVLPDTAKEKPKQGKVLSLGDGKLLDNGKRQAFQVKEGDRVLFTSYAGSEVTRGRQGIPDHVRGGHPGHRRLTAYVRHFAGSTPGSAARHFGQIDSLRPPRLFRSIAANDRTDSIRRQKQLRPHSVAGSWTSRNGQRARRQAGRAGVFYRARTSPFFQCVPSRPKWWVCGGGGGSRRATRPANSPRSGGTAA